jgi:hypothetical protein
MPPLWLWNHGRCWMILSLLLLFESLSAPVVPMESILQLVILVFPDANALPVRVFPPLVPPENRCQQRRPCQRVHLHPVLRPVRHRGETADPQEDERKNDIGRHLPSELPQDIGKRWHVVWWHVGRRVTAAGGCATTVGGGIVAVATATHHRSDTTDVVSVIPIVTPKAISSTTSGGWSPIDGGGATLWILMHRLKTRRGGCCPRVVMLQTR